MASQSSHSDRLSQPSRWNRFWHEPVRAERLAAARICIATALLTSQLYQYLPNLSYYFGPDGIAPVGVNDEYLLRNWRWPILLFNTENMAIVGSAFAVWVAATAAMMLGWRTRIATILVWFFTMCFLARNPNIKNAGDDLMQIALFLLVLSPCGRVLSLDWLRERRREKDPEARKRLATPMISPWAIRLFQLQLCLVYFTTGVAKLRGTTWWDGTSIHNVLNDVTLARWSFAQLPLPLWITATLTYASLIFEVFFPLLVLMPATRRWTLWFGVCFHVGIYLMIEVGWFSFYTIACYSVWIPAEWWDRIRRRRLC